ncbi:hypothetical protein Tco_0428847 [Tanacetum coccineum]
MHGDCQRFNAIYKHLTRKSGESDADLVENAKTSYMERYGNKKFQYDHMWNILKNYPKWNASELIDEDNLQELFGPNPRERPAGKQRATKKQKSVDTSSARVCSGRDCTGGRPVGVCIGASFPGSIRRNGVLKERKEKGLLDPNGGSGGKFEGGFGGNVGGCGGNGRRGGSIAGRGRGSLAKRSMKSKDGLGGGGSRGSKFMANGEECLDGWVGSGEGEVKGGGVDFGVTRILLGEESGGEVFGVDGGAV